MLRQAPQAPKIEAGQPAKSARAAKAKPSTRRAKTRSNAEEYEDAFDGERGRVDRAWQEFETKRKAVVTHIEQLEARLRAATDSADTVCRKLEDKIEEAKGATQGVQKAIESISQSDRERGRVPTQKYRAPSDSPVVRVKDEPGCAASLGGSQASSRAPFKVDLMSFIRMARLR